MHEITPINKCKQKQAHMNNRRLAVNRLWDICVILLHVMLQSISEKACFLLCLMFSRYSNSVCVCVIGRRSLYFALPDSKSIK